MKNQELAFIQNNKVYTTSLIIARALNRKHESVTKAISRHKKQLEVLGDIRHHVEHLENGTKPFKVYLLNRNQVIMLAMKFESSEKVNKMQLEIIRYIEKLEFVVHKLQAQKTNEEWLKTREETKLIRKETTDTIKKFIEYAEAQGSSNAKKYYMNITKMENKALFLITQKFDNLRNLLDKRSLDKLKMADEIVIYALEEGMEQGMNYKDIYQLAKKRIEQFAELTPIPAIPDHWFKRIE